MVLAVGHKVAVALELELVVRRRLRERMPELPQHMPGGAAEMTSEWPSEDCMRMSVAAMGVSLFATNEGYLDDVEVNKVVDFEQALQSHIKSQHAGLLDELNQNQAYDDEVSAKLHEAVKDFKENGAW